MRPPEPCLVLDGSARVGVRIGVLQGGRWVGEGVADEGALEATFACAETALRQAGLALADIRSFAVCVGPGSILGIRIAALAARTWATLEPRPIYVWESLAAVAQAALAAGQARPFAVALESRLKRWNTLVVAPAGALGAPAELEPEQVATLGLPIISTTGSASALFPGAQVVPTPWAALPTLFATTDLLRAEAKPEALNPAATFATWDGERHRGAV
jgi:tRNA threonylcarbamoyladenosine biosynthesis protein TsaB